jgi:hypothetical protein
MFAMPSFWKCVEQASPLLSWRCIPNCEKFPPELRPRIKRLLDLDRSIGSAAAADAKGACEATSVEPNKHLFPAGPFGRRRRDPRARRRLTIAGLIVISYPFA